MASIQRIVSPLTNAVSFRAQVRVKGRPAQSETFPNRKEAQQWAQSIETAIREGRHFPHAAARRTSFDALAKDYTETVLAEFDEGDLATLAERLAHSPMSAIGEKPGHLGFPDMLARALLAAGVG